jgi:nicotinamidase/pyrazinamidase
MSNSVLFWDVDTQADFIYPDGKLYVPGAEMIVLNLKQLTAWAAEHGIMIVASACAHQPGDPEFNQYPPHCLAGTPGQRKIPETLLSNPLIVPNRPVELPEHLSRYQQIILEKQQVDVFSNPNTELLLQRIGRDRQVVLYGVVTEICVAYAACGLLQRGYRVSVVTDAIRHLDESKSQVFLEELTRSGATLVATSKFADSRVRRPAA